MKVYTVGYGGRRTAHLAAMLRGAGVTTLADVRLRPDRASMGLFTKAETSGRGIEAWVTQAGLGYVSLVELGNVFVDAEDWRSSTGASWKRRDPC